MEKMRLLSKDFCLLFVANFVCIAVYYLLMTTMAVYSLNEFKVSNSLAGLSAAIFMVGGVSGRIICSKYYRRLGLKRTALVSLGLMLASCLLYLLSGVGIWYLFIIRILHGISFGVANTVVPAIAVESIPKPRMGEGTGYFMLSMTLGTAIGPLVALFVISGLEYSFLFWICSALVLLALFSTFFVDSGKEVLETKETASKFTIGNVFEKKTWRISLFILIMAISYTSINAFVNNYAASLDLSAYAPFIFVVNSIVLLITRPLAGRLIDRYGDNVVLYPSFFFMAFGYIFCSFVQNGPMLICVGAFMALGFGTALTTGQAVITRRVEREETTQAISTYFLFCDAGGALGPYFLG